MMRWLSIVLILIKKEWRLEWRSKELITLLACNSILLAVMVGAGVSSAVIDRATTEKIFPMLLWVIFTLATITSVTRFNEQELEGRAFEGLLLNGVSGAQMYLAKVFVMTTFFATNFFGLSVLLGISLNQDLSGRLLALALVGIAAAVALAALLALLAAVASTAKLRGILLSIISIPVLFPVFLCGMEMTTELILSGTISQDSPWPIFMFCAQALYLIAGINLFELAVRE